MVPRMISRTLWLHFGEIFTLQIRVAKEQDLTDHNGNRGSGYRLNQGRPVHLGLIVWKRIMERSEAYPVDMLINNGAVWELLFNVNVVIGIVSLLSVPALIFGA